MRPCPMPAQKTGARSHVQQCWTKHNSRLAPRLQPRLAPRPPLCLAPHLRARFITPSVFKPATAARAPQVLEYSELDPAQASAVDPATGRLYYNWSNICMHYFDLRWLSKTVQVWRASSGQRPALFVLL